MNMSYFQEPIKWLKKLKENESIKVDNTFKLQLRNKIRDRVFLNEISELSWKSKVFEWLKKSKYLIGLVSIFGILIVGLFNFCNTEFKNEAVSQVFKDSGLVEKVKEVEEVGMLEVFSACEVLPERFEECRGFYKKDVERNFFVGR